MYRYLRLCLLIQSLLLQVYSSTISTLIYIGNVAGGLECPPLGAVLVLAMFSNQQHQSTCHTASHVTDMIYPIDGA